MTREKKDDELGMIVLVGGIFTIALIAVDIWYSDWKLMFRGWAMIVGILVLWGHLASIVTWSIVLAYYTDPAYDKYRKWLLVLLVATLALVAGVRSASNELKSVLNDANAAKQEQLP